MWRRLLLVIYTAQRHLSSSRSSSRRLDDGGHVLIITHAARTGLRDVRPSAGWSAGAGAGGTVSEEGLGASANKSAITVRRQRRLRTEEYGQATETCIDIRQYKGRFEDEEHGYQGCSRDDSGRRAVETDRTTSSAANLMDGKQEDLSDVNVVDKDHWGGVVAQWQGGVGLATALHG